MTKAKCKILVGVCSAAHYPEKRQACRDTWLAPGMVPDDICFRFFCGEYPNPIPRTLEPWTVWLSAHDGYEELPEKVIAFFKWALENFDFEYLFKCDDDTYVDLSRLASLITPGVHLIGNGFLNGKKRFASGGAGYMLSRAMVEFVVGLDLPKTGNEDVLITNAVYKQVVTFKATPRLRYNEKVWPSNDNNIVSCHWCPPDMLREIHKYKTAMSEPEKQTDRILHVVHPKWTDIVTLYKDGTFHKGPGDTNAPIDGQYRVIPDEKVIILYWAKYPAEKLEQGSDEEHWDCKPLTMDEITAYTAKAQNPEPEGPPAALLIPATMENAPGKANEDLTCPACGQRHDYPAKRKPEIDTETHYGYSAYCPNVADSGGLEGDLLFPKGDLSIFDAMKVPSGNGTVVQAGPPKPGSPEHQTANEIPGEKNRFGPVDPVGPVAGNLYDEANYRSPDASGVNPAQLVERVKARLPYTPPDGEKSVIVVTHGGLGNQMFQYAHGIAVARATGRALHVYHNPQGRPFALEHVFGIKADVDDLPRNLSSKHFEHYDGYKPFNENIATDTLLELAALDEVVVSGYYQNEAFFDNVKGEVREAFSARVCLPAIPGIEEGETPVAVHIRRGDFIGSMHHVCKNDYYTNAMFAITSRIEKPFFVVVSDDPEWSEEFMKNTTFARFAVLKDQSEDDAFDTLRSAKHHILSNSSFGWWAAYLADSELTICPNRWLKGRSWDIALPHWLQLNPR